MTNSMRYDDDQFEKDEKAMNNIPTHDPQNGIYAQELDNGQSLAEAEMNRLSYLSPQEKKEGE